MSACTLRLRTVALMSLRPVVKLEPVGAFLFSANCTAGPFWWAAVAM